MTVRLALISTLAVVASCAALPQDSATRPAVELVGRTAGAAQRCVLLDQSQSLRVSDTDRHMLLYGNGHVIWANRLSASCGFSSSDTLVTEPIGSYYCRGDLVRSFDRFTKIPGPACVLGDFVPFTH